MSSKMSTSSSFAVLNKKISIRRNNSTQLVQPERSLPVQRTPSLGQVVLKKLPNGIFVTSVKSPLVKVTPVKTLVKPPFKTILPQPEKKLGFDELIELLSQKVIWKTSWHVFEQLDGICFYRFNRGVNLSEMKLSFRIVVKRKDMRVEVFREDVMAESQELDWKLKDCRLETLSQLLELLEHYAKEPQIKTSPPAKPDPKILIKEAIEALQGFLEPTNKNEIVEPFMTLVLEGLVRDDCLSNDTATKLISNFRKQIPASKKKSGVRTIGEIMFGDEEDQEEGEVDEVLVKNQQKLVEKPKDIEEILFGDIVDDDFDLEAGEDFFLAETDDEEVQKIVEAFESSATETPKQIPIQSGSKKTSFLCDQCGRNFPTNRQRYCHQSSAHGSKFYCDKCYRSFSKKTSLMHHLDTHLETRSRVKCPQCDSNVLPKSLQRHIKIAHMGWRPAPCKFCGKVFRSKVNTELHEKTHLINSGRRFNCSKCGKRCQTADSLNDHHRRNCIGKNLWSYACFMCSKKFPVKHKAAEHLAKKHNFIIENSLRFCFICRKEFADYAAHARTHGCRFVCKFCGLRLSNQTKLDNHIAKQHKNGGEDRPFKCDLCLASFKSRNHIQGHIQSLHTRDDQKKFVCATCGRRYGMKHELNNHLRSAHTSAKPYPCNYCEETFKYIMDMKSHCLTVHSEDCCYPCEDCDQKFSLLVELKNHQKQIHGGNLLVHKYHKIETLAQ